MVIFKNPQNHARQPRRNVDDSVGKGQEKSRDREALFRSCDSRKRLEERREIDLSPVVMLAGTPLQNVVAIFKFVLPSPLHMSSLLSYPLNIFGTYIIPCQYTRERGRIKNPISAKREDYLISTKCQINLQLEIITEIIVNLTSLAGEYSSTRKIVSLKRLRVIFISIC